MLAALRKLGRLTEVQTKTTLMLAPEANVSWRDIRAAIKGNLHPKKGNAFYVNLRSSKSFEYGSKTGFKWKAVV